MLAVGLRSLRPLRLKQAVQIQQRGIARLVTKDKGLSSFDYKDATAPVKVNPFNLPAPANNAAEFVLTTIDSIFNWTRTSSLWPLTFGSVLLHLFIRSFFLYLCWAHGDGVGWVGSVLESETAKLLQTTTSRSTNDNSGFLPSILYLRCIGSARVASILLD
ncbi:hypothetical protein BDR26DRAFT_115042 [Obelidium mucronatum]|nr:hypothetical protein BDR26DRAFT_115042 [Obelidium mucronatum]